ncbi:hypothetical protein ASG12_15350 [Williamsia sp. Leaf354]|uniref:hypothetical protein n=1 Tax=Williamsia sp. Leaf354 TaxID=1736349 RepID=UPI0006F46282|nr:hypothetical protein [Williamsia sp. Leaf354]KQR97322.1 hypothetical protein ASG12_15350 [Williamsia sp. Leaf354]
MTATSATNPRPPITTLGVSAGGGMTHCALVTVDDHERLVVDSRVIEVDHTDRLDRAGRVNAGIDLMLGSAASAGLSVAAIGVASRDSGHRAGFSSRGSGPRRQIHLLGDAESVAHALAESGEIAAHEETILIDCGDTGVTISRLDPATGKLTAATRSTVMSGHAIDGALADLVGDDLPSTTRASRRALISACRTAKEELAEQDATTILVRGRPVPITADMVSAVSEPMAERLADAVADYVRAQSIPEDTALVLVGGVANIAAVRRVLEHATKGPVVVASTPDLLGAVGAALLARPNRSSALRLAFIGGRGHRDWWSAVPLAIVGCFLAVAMLAVYAFTAALDGSSSPVRDVEVTATTAARPDAPTADRPDTATPVVRTTDARPTAPNEQAPSRSIVVQPTETADLPTTTTSPTLGYPNGGMDRRQERPWATTELPTPEDTSGPTSTISATSPQLTPNVPGPPETSGSPSGSGPQTSPPLLSPVVPTDLRSLTPYPLVPIPAPRSTPAPGSVTPSVTPAP